MAEVELDPIDDDAEAAAALEDAEIRRAWAGVRALIDSPDVPTGVRAELTGQVYTIAEQVDAAVVVDTVIAGLISSGYTVSLRPGDGPA